MNFQGYVNQPFYLFNNGGDNRSNCSFMRVVANHCQRGYQCDVMMGPFSHRPNPFDKNRYPGFGVFNEPAWFTNVNQCGEDIYSGFGVFNNPAWLNKTENYQSNYQSHNGVWESVTKYAYNYSDNSGIQTWKNLSNNFSGWQGNKFERFDHGKTCVGTALTNPPSRLNYFSHDNATLKSKGVHKMSKVVPKAKPWNGYWTPNEILKKLIKKAPKKNRKSKTKRKSEISNISLNFEHNKIETQCSSKVTNKNNIQNKVLCHEKCQEQSLSSIPITKIFKMIKDYIQENNECVSLQANGDENNILLDSNVVCIGVYICKSCGDEFTFDTEDEDISLCNQCIDTKKGDNLNIIQIDPNFDNELASENITSNDSTSHSNDGKCSTSTQNKTNDESCFSDIALDDANHNSNLHPKTMITFCELCLDELIDDYEEKEITLCSVCKDTVLRIDQDSSSNSETLNHNKIISCIDLATESDDEISDKYDHDSTEHFGPDHIVSGRNQIKPDNEISQNTDENIENVTYLGTKRQRLASKANPYKAFNYLSYQSVFYSNKNNIEEEFCQVMNDGLQDSSLEWRALKTDDLVCKSCNKKCMINACKGWLLCLKCRDVVKRDEYMNGIDNQQINPPTNNSSSMYNKDRLLYEKCVISKNSKVGNFSEQLPTNRVYIDKNLKNRRPVKVNNAKNLCKNNSLGMIKMNRVERGIAGSGKKEWSPNKITEIPVNKPGQFTTVEECNKKYEDDSQQMTRWKIIDGHLIWI